MEWTQADLAARLGASRVAVSHFEMGLAQPSERTVVLLAGLFKIEPHDLVAGTNYPQAKQERLPATACRYTELELDLALLKRDLSWLKRLRAEPTSGVGLVEMLDIWNIRLREWRATSLDKNERVLLDEASTLVRGFHNELRLQAAGQSALST